MTEQPAASGVEIALEPRITGQGAMDRTDHIGCLYVNAKSQSVDLGIIPSGRANLSINSSN